MEAKRVLGRKVRMSMKNRITTRMNRSNERDRKSLAQDTVLSVSLH